MAAKVHQEAAQVILNEKKLTVDVESVLWHSLDHTCPFAVGSSAWRCTIISRLGKRGGYHEVRCPTDPRWRRDRRERDIKAPPDCPLRSQDIVVKRKT